MTALQPPPLRDLPPGRLEQLRLHLLEEITAPPRRELELSRWRRRRTAGVVAVAAAAVVVLGAIGVGTRWGATEASAAQVRNSLTQGLRAPRNIRGEFSVQTRPARPTAKPAHGCSKCKPPLPIPSSFVLGAD